MGICDKKIKLCIKDKLEAAYELIKTMINAKKASGNVKIVRRKMN